MHRIEDLIHRSGAVQKGASDLVTFIRRTDDRLARIEAALAELTQKENAQMSLSTQEADAFSKLGADIGTWKASLQAQVDQLTASAAALTSSESADQATIATLNDQIASLNASVDNTPDVVAAINALDSQVNGSTAPQTSTGDIRTGLEPAVPGGSPAPENPSQAPDATTVPGGTASVTTDLNAPSQQNVDGGAAVTPSESATVPAPDPAPGTTSAAAESEAPGAPSIEGGPADAAPVDNVGAGAPASTTNVAETGAF